MTQPWKSKTMWANVLAIAGLLLSSTFGVELTPEAATGALALINVILRIVTKEPIDWS